MKFNIAAFAIAMMSLTASAQLTPTTFQDCISNNATIITHTTSNLVSSQYAVIPVRQGKNLAFCPQFYGGNATNTGTVGWRFDLIYKTNGLMTTTKPITLTSTANGTTVVRDYLVIPWTTIGPADSIALTSITNNTFTGTGAGGSLIISNAPLQWTAP